MVVQVLAVAGWSMDARCCRDSSRNGRRRGGVGLLVLIVAVIGFARLQSPGHPARCPTTPCKLSSNASINKQQNSQPLISAMRRSIFSAGNR